MIKILGEELGKSFEAVALLNSIQNWDIRSGEEFKQRILGFLRKYRQSLKEGFRRALDLLYQRISMKLKFHYANKNPCKNLESWMGVRKKHFGSLTPELLKNQFFWLKFVDDLMPNDTSSNTEELKSLPKELLEFL